MPSRFLAASVILAAFALVACGEADSSSEVQADAAWLDTGPDASNASDAEGGPDAPDAAANDTAWAIEATVGSAITIPRSSPAQRSTSPLAQATTEVPRARASRTTVGAASTAEG